MSTPTDPRSELKTDFEPATAYVTEANLVCRDGSTFKYTSQYEGEATTLNYQFNKCGMDGIFCIIDLGSELVTGDSGPICHVVKTGIMAVTKDKRKPGSSSDMRVVGHEAMWKMLCEIYLVLKAHYRTNDKVLFGYRPNIKPIGSGNTQLIYSPTVEVHTYIWLETTSGTSRVTEHIQRWTNIYIGYSSATVGTTYTNLVGGLKGFRHGRAHPAPWRTSANLVSSETPNQQHSSYIWELVLSGDSNYAFRTQVVTAPTLTNGTGVATGSPITLAPGNNTITVTSLGTFVISLPYGCTGTASSGTCTVSGSPVTLTPGVDGEAGLTTITTTTAIGTITINVTGLPAIDDDGDSPLIGYFRAVAAIRGDDGTSKTRLVTITNGYCLESEMVGPDSYAYRGIAKTISYVDA